MTDLRKALVAYYRALRRYGLNDSHSGNASVRDGETVWVTPSGASADNLSASDLVACALPDSIGERASLDASLHLAVYRKCESARAVLHAHSPHTIAMTLSGREFTPVDHEAALYFPHVPVVALPSDGYWERHKSEAPELVAEQLAKEKVCVLAGHGVYARGADLDEAYKWLCSLEHSAQIAWLASTGKRGT